MYSYKDDCQFERYGAGSLIGRYWQLYVVKLATTISLVYFIVKLTTRYSGTTQYDARTDQRYSSYTLWATDSSPGGRESV